MRPLNRLKPPDFQCLEFNLLGKILAFMIVAAAETALLSGNVKAAAVKVAIVLTAPAADERALDQAADRISPSADRGLSARRHDWFSLIAERGQVTPSLPVCVGDEDEGQDDERGG